MRILLLALLLAGRLSAEAGFPGESLDAGTLDQALQGSGGIAEAEKRNIAEDKLSLGGTLSAALDAEVYEGRDTADNLLHSPMQAFLWLDSRLEKGARVLGRVRTAYDPSSATSLTPAAVSASLEELKVSFDIAQVLFVTAGRQKIKHGVAKLYNPSDFLNALPRNFFLPADERPGVDLLKLHLPVGMSNFYAGALQTRAGGLDRVGGWGRAEMAYASGGEVSVAVLAQKNQPTKLSADLSQALGIIDIYGEVAAQPKAPNGSWDLAYSAGFSWVARYGDRSSNTLTLEAEYFQAGAMIETGGLVIYLPQPLNVKDTRLLFHQLYDFYGQGALSRLDLIREISRQITGSVYGASHWGVVGSPLRQPYQLADAGIRLDVIF